MRAARLILTLVFCLAPVAAGAPAEAAPKKAGRHVVAKKPRPRPKAKKKPYHAKKARPAAKATKTAIVRAPESPRRAAPPARVAAAAAPGPSGSGGDDPYSADRPLPADLPPPPVAGFLEMPGAAVVASGEAAAGDSPSAPLPGSLTVALGYGSLRERGPVPGASDGASSIVHFNRTMLEVRGAFWRRDGFGIDAAVGLGYQPPGDAAGLVSVALGAGISWGLTLHAPTGLRAAARLGVAFARLQGVGDAPGGTPPLGTWLLPVLGVVVEAPSLAPGLGLALRADALLPGGAAAGASWALGARAGIGVRAGVEASLRLAGPLHAVAGWSSTFLRTRLYADAPAGAVEHAATLGLRLSGR